MLAAVVVAVGILTELQAVMEVVALVETLLPQEIPEQQTLVGVEVELVMVRQLPEGLGVLVL